MLTRDEYERMGQHQAVINSRDLPVKGEMSTSDSSDCLIDLNLLSVDEFLKKHC